MESTHLAAPIPHSLHQLLLSFMIAKEFPAKDIYQKAKPTKLAEPTPMLPQRALFARLLGLLEVEDKNKREVVSANPRPCENEKNVGPKPTSSSLKDLLEDNTQGDFSIKLDMSHITDMKTMRQDTDLLMQQSDLRKFCEWASGKLYLEPNGPVLSIMSKASRKEVVSSERAGQLVMQIHTLNGEAGNFHLEPVATMDIYKSRYTFGNDDFGITADFIQSIIRRCTNGNCAVKNRSDIVNLPEKTTPLLSEPFDRFYKDIAEIVVAGEHQDLFCSVDSNKQKVLKRSVAAVKEAGNPMYYGRVQKRKITEGNGDHVPVPRKRNPAEDMPLSEAYDCLVTTALQMRKEFINTICGERRHHDSLHRSLIAAQVLLRRCQTTHKQVMNKLTKVEVKAE